MAHPVTMDFYSCALNLLELHEVQFYLEGGKGTRVAWRGIEAHFASVRRFRGSSITLAIGTASHVVLARGPLLLAASGAPGHSANLAAGNSADNSAECPTTNGCDGATVTASRLLKKCDSNASSALTSDSDDDALVAEGHAPAAAAQSADRDIFAEDPERTAAFPLFCRVPAAVHAAATELMLALQQPAQFEVHSEVCRDMMDSYAPTRQNAMKRAFINTMRGLTGGGPVKPMIQTVGFALAAAAQ